MGPLDATKPWQTKGIEAMSFNTAISQLMIFNNEMMKMDKRYREPCETLQKLFRLGNGSASGPAALALVRMLLLSTPSAGTHTPRPQRPGLLSALK